MSNASQFVCNMAALSNEQRLLHQELAALLQTRLRAIREIADGYDFEFPFETAIYEALARITPLEHACCPFFDISIRLEHEGGKLWWRLTGREEVKPFIRAEFGPWFG